VFLLRTGTQQFAQAGVGAQVSSGMNNTKVNHHSFSSIPTAVIRQMASMKADEKLSKEGEFTLSFTIYPVMLSWVTLYVVIFRAYLPHFVGGTSLVI
jgi:hypothetical protein